MSGLASIDPGSLALSLLYLLVALAGSALVAAVLLKSGVFRLIDLVLERLAREARRANRRAADHPGHNSRLLPR